MKSGTIFHYRLFRTYMSLFQERYKMYQRQMEDELCVNKKNMCLSQPSPLLFPSPVCQCTYICPGSFVLENTHLLGRLGYHSAQDHIVKVLMYIIQTNRMYTFCTSCISTHGHKQTTKTSTKIQTKWTKKHRTTEEEMEGSTSS